MMATTHAYLALALAVIWFPVSGEHATPTAVLSAAFLGGLFPDLDTVTNHRKTLHFPVYLPVAACLVFLSYVAVGYQPLFLLGVVLAAAGLHSVTDVFAGGLGHEPWNDQSERAVFNHFLGRWHAPRRIVRYSGSPEDLGLAAAFAVPVILSSATDPAADAALTVVLVGSTVYVAMRRQVPAITRSIRALLPRTVVERMPSVEIEDQ
jgi:hypothetical protein